MRFYVSTFLMFLLILLMLIQPVQARAYTDFRDDSLVCMEATQKFEHKYQIKEHLLSTIASVESGRWNSRRQQKVAWPWTVNAKGKGMFFETKAEAVREVKRLQKAGVKSIDVGCMQINLAYHPDAFRTVEEAFDPQHNVEYGAKFLSKLYETRDNDWIKAAMAYHSSVPHKAEVYKKKLDNAFNSVRQILQLAHRQNVYGEHKKLAGNSVYDINKKKKERNVANKAQAWREAKLREYRARKGL